LGIFRNLSIFLGKGNKRFKKNSDKNCPKLTDDDIEYLKLNTRYDEKEIREWFR
jgi:hypothetical protein